MDGLARAEAEAAAAHVDVLLAPADQVHLDAAVARIVDRLVPEGGEVESAAELAVDAGEQVEVEGGRDAGGIVVGAERACAGPS